MKKKAIVFLCAIMTTVFLWNFCIANVATWDVSIDEVTFKSGWIDSFAAAELDNGNCVIVYEDSDDDRGKFVVYDEHGIEVLSETVFDYGRVHDLSVTGLVGGVFFIAYEQDSNGKFTICDDHGNIGAETVFKASRTGLITTAALTGGNVLIAYRDDSDYKGKYVIYDADGDLVSGETTYFNGSSGGISATALLNGNALISYWDGSGDRGAFVICDSTGNIVKTPAAFAFDDIGGPHATTLTNGNVFISYSKGAYPYSGYYVILDQDGNEVTGETGLDLSGSVDRIGAAVMSNHDIFVSYRRGDGSDNSGNFIVLDPEGNTVRERTVFYNGVLNNIAPVSLSGGNIMVPFWEGGEPWFGKFAYIYDPAVNPADLDRDGDVDGYDLGILCSGYGTEYNADNLQALAAQLSYAR